MKKLSIQIDEPCHEDWSQMKLVELGRHCQQCEKTVVDFTNMSKRSIVEYLENNKGSTCGRFYSSQIGINLLPPKKNKWFIKYAALFIGLLPISTYAQFVETKTEINQENLTIQEVETKGKLTIDGTVIDSESKEAMLFGAVTLYNKKKILITGVETDLDGGFTIDIKKGEYLEVSYIAYESRIFSFEDLTRMNGDYVLPIKEGVMQDPLIVLGNFEVSGDRDIKKVKLDEVEIVGYKSPLIEVDESADITITGALMNVHVENIPWILRMWKKLESVVKVSYHEAKVNQVEDRLLDEESIENEEYDQFVFIDTVEGITAVDAPFITIAPNPNQGFFRMTIPKGFDGGVIQIMSANNLIVYTQEVNTPIHEVDISEAPSGSYIVSFISNAELIVSEIFIKK